MYSYSKILRPYLELIRPANIITALADVLSGFIIAKSFSVGYAFSSSNLFLLLLTTACLYGGGIAFNDVVDAKRDAIERPERAISRGAISRQKALVFSSGLLILGIILAAMVGYMSAVIAIAIVLSVIFYNLVGKRNFIIAPFSMGLCRALNFLLGMSLSMLALYKFWYFSFIPLVYVAAVTVISRKELVGNNRHALIMGSILYLLSFILFIILVLPMAMYKITPILFLLILIFVLGRKVLKAYMTRESSHTMASVKIGVLLLIILNATFVSAFEGFYTGIAVALLLPLSIIVAKKFSVT